VTWDKYCGSSRASGQVECVVLVRRRRNAPSCTRASTAWALSSSWVGQGSIETASSGLVERFGSRSTGSRLSSFGCALASRLRGMRGVAGLGCAELHKLWALFCCSLQSLRISTSLRRTNVDAHFQEVPTLQLSLLERIVRLWVTVERTCLQFAKQHPRASSTRLLNSQSVINAESNGPVGAQFKWAIWVCSHAYRFVLRSRHPSFRTLAVQLAYHPHIHVIICRSGHLDLSRILPR